MPCTHANNQVSTILLVDCNGAKTTKQNWKFLRFSSDWAHMLMSFWVAKGWNYTFNSHTCFHFINREEKQKKFGDETEWKGRKKILCEANLKLMAFETFQLLKMFLVRSWEQKSFQGLSRISKDLLVFISDFNSNPWCYLYPFPILYKFEKKRTLKGTIKSPAIETYS